MSDNFTEPSYTIQQMLLEIYDEDIFKTRFPGIARLRAESEDDRAIPTPSQYLAMEGHISDMLARHDISSAGIDFNLLVENIIANRVSPTEVTDRMALAARMVSDAPQAVRDTFLEWYGTGPEGGVLAQENLMKTFLDPDDTWGGSWIDVQSKSEASYIGTEAGFQGLDIGKTRAELIGSAGIGEEEWTKGFGLLAEQRPLFAEKIGEQDLSLEDEGLEAMFDVDLSDMSSDDIRQQLNRRRNRRVAAFRGGGGAMVTQTGTGLGTAR